MKDRFSTYYDQMSRVHRSHLEARKAYNMMSRIYDVLSGPFEKKYRLKALSLLEIPEGASVLEIGCGTGNALVPLAQRVGASGKVFGLDLSPAMLEVARKKLARRSLLPRVVLEEEDALYMPFLPQSFDAIFMSFTLELFDTPEIPLVLERCRQVLKKEGKMAVVSLSRTEPNTMVRLYEWGHRQFPQFLDCRPIYVREALIQAGFRISHAETDTLWGLPIEIILAKNI